MFYRTSAWSVGERLAELVAERRRELPSLPSDVVDTYARRYGRALAGIAGVTIGLFVFLSPIDKELREAGAPTIALLAAWPSMLGARALGRWLGPAMLRHRMEAALSALGTHRDLARLEELGSGAQAARALTASLEPWSLALPMMALSLLAPLTLHVFVALMTGTFSLRGYSGWVGLSGMIVGHAHLFLAAACARYARALRRSTPEHYTRHGWEVWGATVGVSAVPGVVLLLLPPAITAVTGLLFVPVMFSWANRTVTRERAMLASDQRSCGS